MNVNSVNSVSFQGKSQTASGNEYKKTHAGAITGGVVGTAVYGSSIYVIGRQEGGFKKFFNEFTKMVVEETKMKTPAMSEARIAKSVKIGGVIGLLLGVASFVGLGAIVDGVVNHHRANKADKAAKAE